MLLFYQKKLIHGRSLSDFSLAFCTFHVFLSLFVSEFNLNGHMRGQRAKSQGELANTKYSVKSVLTLF